MHEVSVVRSLFALVREKMINQFGQTFPVKKIRVVIGKLSTVVPASFEFAFETVSKDTEFENAELEIEYVPLRIKCRDCKSEMQIDEPFMFCRECESFQVEITTGKELLVESFEIEDDEVRETVVDLSC
jgi:hydrogenase nickel incorporation protein HypA/HybF